MPLNKSNSKGRQEKESECKPIKRQLQAKDERRRRRGGTFEWMDQQDARRATEQKREGASTDDSMNREDALKKRPRSSWDAHMQIPERESEMQGNARNTPESQATLLTTGKGENTEKSQGGDNRTCNRESKKVAKQYYIFRVRVKESIHNH